MRQCAQSGSTASSCLPSCSYSAHAPCRRGVALARRRPGASIDRSSWRQAAAQAQQASSNTAVSEFATAAPGRFTDAERKAFAQEFPVRGYEVSPNQKASMVTISNLMQELAANHAVGMWGRAEKGFAGLPNPDGKQPNIIFVMTRLQIRMFQYPKWGDILKLETYFTDEGRLAARRDWVVADTSTGRQLGAATSSWVNINMDTRRITKLPDDLRERLLTFAVPHSKLALPAEESKKKLPDMNEQLQVEGPAQVARRSDMDMNGHINNVVYLAWALEAVPDHVYSEHSLYEMEIDFKAECQAGETVRSCVEQVLGHVQGADGELCFLHSLRRSDGNGSSTEMVRARTTWRKV